MIRYLNAFATANTRQFEKMRSVAIDIYDARSFELLGDSSQFLANTTFFKFGSSSLSYSGSGSPVRVEFRDSDYIRLQFCVTGSGKTSTRRASADVDQTAVVHSRANAVLEFGQSFEQFVLRLDQPALEKDLASLLGRQPKEPISIGMTASCNRGQTKRLREHIFHIVHTVDISDEPIPAPLLREMDQMVRLATLYGMPNNFTDLLAATPKSLAPWQVSRVEEWIDANWRESLTVERLAEISGASARSIHAAFRSARGYTPMAYLKTVRLNAARELLLRAEPHTSVTGIMFSCNFMNPGHFAHDYRQQFGELPSETLRRGRFSAG